MMIWFSTEFRCCYINFVCWTFILDSHFLQETEQKLEEDIKKYREDKEIVQAKLEEALADKDILEAKLNHLQSQSEQSNNAKPPGKSCTLFSFQGLW